MTKKEKDGVSVQEIENFGKRFHVEIFFTIVFILACFFSFFYMKSLSIYGAGIGAIVGIWFPKQITMAVHKIFHFSHKQHKATLIMIAVVGIILSIFLPSLIFLCIGLMAGRSFHRHATDECCHKDGKKNHSDHS